MITIYLIAAVLFFGVIFAYLHDVSRSSNEPSNDDPGNHSNDDNDKTDNKDK